MRAWRPEQIMPLSYLLAVPDDLPPGSYALRVGLIDQLSRRRIPLDGGQPEAVAKTFEIPLPVDHRTPEISADINFANMLRLEGYTLTPSSQGLEILLFWRAIENPDADYTLFVHVVDGDDRIVAQKDGEPLSGRYSTSLWSPRDLFVEERFFPSVPEGEYRIYIGWYTHQESGWERLSTVAQGDAPASSHVLLDTVTVP